MADSNVPALTENTAPVGADGLYLVDDMGGTPADNRIYAGSFNLLPNGYMVNGKISVTVALNNITVALKTLANANPSATDPVSVWINGSFRRCTAALSVTVNAGANSFNAGSAELATKEIDYFAYLLWNTTPATDIVDIGFARISHGTVYSDFSATATSEKYFAHANASAPAATDDCTVIGRFAATLSAGAGYTWTVPTYTNTNLIQRPTYETRWLQWQPVYTADSGTYNTVTTNFAYYKVMSREVRVIVKATGTTSATPAILSATLPFEALVAAAGSGFVYDSTVLGGIIQIAAGTPDVLQFSKYNAGAFAAGATKVIDGEIFYIIE